jgi:ribose transport system substrate-binding protein
MRGHLRRGVLAALLVGTLGLVACGGDDDSSDDAGTNSPSAAAPQNACGAVPERMPEDPDGVLAELPEDVQAGYNLYPAPVQASAWADWKPEDSGPYTIYFSPGNVSTPYIQAMLKAFKELKAKTGAIREVVVQNSNNDVQTQIQQLRQAIRQKVDVMVVLPLSPTSVKPIFDAAAKAGIPIIEPLNAANHPHVVGLAGNTMLEGATIGKAMADVLGGKGNILEVHGIPGVDADTQIFTGAKEAFKSCPDIKFVGQIVGQFQPAVAKGETLKFLAAHPQKIEGALQSGGMAGGVIQAFKQQGRDEPTVGDTGGTPGALAYWRDNKDTYKGVASGKGPEAVATASWDVAMRMLAGGGLKVTDLAQAPQMITEENLNDWVKPEWTENTIGYAEPPPGTFFTDEFLNNFFQEPDKTLAESDSN